VLLGQYSSNHPIRSVGLNLGQESRVIVCEQGGCGQELLESLKGCFAFVCESEDYVLTCELVQWLGNVPIVLDKPPIEVTESKEQLNTLYRTQELLISDCGVLLRVDF